jgi:hypothetical protein
MAGGAAWLGSTTFVPVVTRTRAGGAALLE